jgi:pimeloyl-ACP methyl ester carboxylesterase
MKTNFLFISMLITLLTTTVSPKSNSDISQLFNTATLKNSLAVQQILASKGFTKTCFTTKDNFKICASFLDQSKTKKIKGTILYCAGFYPGTKEGMASFYALLENQPYNFLFFDARGHQESDGSLFSYNNLKQYGSSEYQDILAAIDFLQRYNSENKINKNIVIHGICSGAFHSLKAIDHLQNINDSNASLVKGIIFDSGWLRLTDIVEPTVHAETQSYFKKSYFSWLAKPISYLIRLFYRCVLKNHHAKVDNIETCLKNTKCPIFFIHCTNDPYVPITPIQTLTQELNKHDAWWITHDSHATYHLKEQDLYSRKIKEFLSKVL